MLQASSKKPIMNSTNNKCLFIFWAWPQRLLFLVVVLHIQYHTMREVGSIDMNVKFELFTTRRFLIIHEYLLSDARLSSFWYVWADIDVETIHAAWIWYKRRLGFRNLEGLCDMAFLKPNYIKLKIKPEQMIT